jgi:predicted deacylase
MRHAFEIGNGRIKTGTIGRAAIDVGPAADGRRREIPVLVCHGSKRGPVLWINGGSRGDAPEGAFSIFRLFEGLEASRMAGTVVGVPALNVPAFEAGTRGNPLDMSAHDMNRHYPGRPDGYPTERAAWAHWCAMRETCDLQIAVRSGGEHAYLAHTIFAEDTAGSLELAAAMGPPWDLVFRSGLAGADPASKMSEHGGAGITVELGGGCRTLSSDFHDVADDLAAGYLNVMRHFGMVDGEAAYAGAWRTGHAKALRAPASGMWVGDPGLVFEQPLAEGAPLGAIYDLYGDVQAELLAPTDGVVLGLRSRPAVLEGEWCCLFGVIDEVRDDLIAGGDDG